MKLPRMLLMAFAAWLAFTAEGFAAQRGQVNGKADKPVAVAEDACAALCVLARERSLAESYALLLGELRALDRRRYILGIRDYALAKADFDGVIAQMRSDIVTGERGKASPRLLALLDEAVAHRIAFTDGVDAMLDKLSGGQTQATRGIKDYLIGGADELIGLLRAAAGAIWDKYWQLQDEERRALLDELDAMRWKSFAELSGQM